MRMRNVPKFRKIPKGLARGEPLRHQDHPRPTTRRQFIAQGFMAGGASVLLPSLAALVANPRIAQRGARAGYPGGRHRLRHHARGGDDPLHLLRPLGRCQHRGLERARRRPHRAARFPERGGLQQARASGHHGAELAAPRTSSIRAWRSAITPTARKCAESRRSSPTRRRWPTSRARSFPRSRRTIPTRTRTTRCTASGRRARGVRCSISSARTARFRAATPWRRRA